MAFNTQDVQQESLLDISFSKLPDFDAITAEQIEYSGLSAFLPDPEPSGESYAVKQESKDESFLFPDDDDVIWQSVPPVPVTDTDCKASSLLQALAHGAEDIPKNAETALVINQTMQEVVEDFLRKIDLEIQQLHDTKVFLQNQTVQEVDSEEAAAASSDLKIFSSITYDDEEEDNGSHVTRRLLRNPYFMTNTGNQCHQNVEEKRRNERGEFNFADLKTGYRFSDAEAKRLVNSVSDCRKDDLVRPLLGKRKGLLERLNSSKTKALDSVTVKLKAELKDLNKEIDEIKRSSSEEILADLTLDDIDDIPFDKVTKLAFKDAVDSRSAYLVYRNLYRPGIRIDTWSNEEDDMLRNLIDELGDDNWDKIAERMGNGRTSFLCCQRWHLSLSMGKKNSWSAEDDAMLVKAVKECSDDHSINWTQVSAYLPCRAATDCKRRHFQVCSETIQWKPSEIMALLTAVEKFGIGTFSWASIAMALGSRQAASCRQQYIQYVTSSESPWSYSEDRSLFLFVEQKCEQLQASSGINLEDLTLQDVHKMPINWHELLPMFPGRCVASLMLRWRSIRMSKVKWDSLRNTASYGEFDNKHVQVDDIKVHTKQDEADSVWTPNEARQVLLKTPLLTKLMKIMRDKKKKSSHAGSAGTDTDQIRMLLDDAERGFIVPRPLGNEEKDTKVIFDRLVRETFYKNAIKKKIQAYIVDYLRETDDLTDHMRIHCETLTNPDDDSHFWIVLEDLMTRDKELSTAFCKCKTLKQCNDLVPTIVGKMIHLDPKRSTFLSNIMRHQSSRASSSRQQKEPKSLSAESPSTSKSPSKLTKSYYGVVDNSVGETKQSLLLEIHELLTKKQKVLGTNIQQDYVSVSKSMYNQILAEGTCYSEISTRIKSACDQRIIDFLSQYMKVSDEDEEQILSSTPAEPDTHLREVIPPLPPTKASMIGFKALLMHRENLLKSGGELFSKISEIKKKSFEFPTNTKERSAMENLKEILSNPRYALLKARFFSTFAWPALLATLDFNECLKRKESLLNLKTETVVLESDDSDDSKVKCSRKRKRNLSKSTGSDSSCTSMSEDSDNDIDFRSNKAKKKRKPPTPTAVPLNPTKVVLSVAHPVNGIKSLPFFHYEGNIHSNMNECAPETFLAPKPKKFVKKVLERKQFGPVKETLKAYKKRMINDKKRNKQKRERDRLKELEEEEERNRTNNLMNSVTLSTGKIINVPNEFGAFLRNGYTCAAIYNPVRTPNA